jgi:hypothetical protein
MHRTRPKGIGCSQNAQRREKRLGDSQNASNAAEVHRTQSKENDPSHAA